MPRDGVREAHARPKPVDHGQDCEQAGVQGPQQALLGDEGAVALGQAGRPPAEALDFLREVYQLAQQPVAGGAEVG